MIQKTFPSSPISLQGGFARFELFVSGVELPEPEAGAQGKGENCPVAPGSLGTNGPEKAPLLLGGEGLRCGEFRVHAASFGWAHVPSVWGRVKGMIFGGF